MTSAQGQRPQACCPQAPKNPNLFNESVYPETPELRQPCRQTLNTRPLPPPPLCPSPSIPGGGTEGFLPSILWRLGAGRGRISPPN